MPSPSFSFFRYLSYLVLLAIVVHIYGWATGRWPGNVEVFLTFITGFCGMYWALDKTVWGPERAIRNEKLIDQYESESDCYVCNSGKTAEEWLAKTEKDEEELAEKLEPPLWISNTAGCFWVLALVWGVRSFLWEPFYVPSGSMLPTLRTGDTIAVNKWEDGIRMPGTSIWLTGPYLHRGDPIVFLYPEDKNMHFIKRIVAIEGDTVTYKDKNLIVNGKPYTQASIARGALNDLRLGHESENMSFFTETNTSSLSYTIQVEGSPSSVYEPTEKMLATWPNACVHDGSSVTCKVPPRHVFVLGDNRDNSLDSRYWGFVPYNDVKGKATRYLINSKSIGTSKPLSPIP